MGINLLDIERYKKVFDSYDTNKSGVLENLEEIVDVHSVGDWVAMRINMRHPFSPSLNQHFCNLFFVIYLGVCSSAMVVLIFDII